MDNTGAVAEIKTKVPIVDIIQQRTALQKAGRNTMKGLCPFHNEKTPSFYVWTDSNSYHCFGCKESGDVFTFVMKMQGLDFSDTLRELANKAGVQLEVRQANAEEDKRKERVRQLNETAADYFHELLKRSPTAEDARQYALERGVNQTGLLTFKLGYALDSWDALLTYLRERQYSDAEIVTAGLAIEREGGGLYDRFRNRLMFPIRDRTGSVIGFGGRALSKEANPKYMNSPQTLLFDKSNVLYALDLARDAIRKADEVVIVEGYMDALIAHQSGVSNVVAGLGTAVGEKQIAQLKKLTANITLALDADAAGSMAALREAEVLRQTMDSIAIPVYNARGLVGYEYKLQATIKIATLPPGEDPDNVIRRSVDEWRQIISKALPVVEHYLSLLPSKHDLATPRGKREAVEEIAPLLAAIGDAVERDGYVQRLAKIVGVDSESVRHTVKQKAQSAIKRSSGREVVTIDQTEYRAVEDRPAPPPKPRLNVEDAVVALVLRYPTLRDDVFMPELTELGGTESRLLYSALLDRSVAELEKDSGVDKATNRLTIEANTGNPLDDAGIIDDDDPNLPYPTLRATLDPALRGYLLRLVRSVAGEPPTYGRELELELQKRVRRMRDRRDRRWLKKAEEMLQDLRDSGDAEEAHLLDMLRQVDVHLTRLRNYAPPHSPIFRDSRDALGVKA